MKKIKLLIIEDNKLLRSGIISMLKKQQDIYIIPESENNKYTTSRIRKLKPEMILLDLGLRNRNSLSVVEFVKKDFPNIKVIVMDIAPIQEDINQFVKAGASGFIQKDAAFHELLRTIRTVAEGTYVSPPNSSPSLLSEIVEHAIKGNKIKLKDAVRMSKKERELIGLIGDGLNNKEIGHRLHVSTFKVKSHIHSIMEKITLHTRLEAANNSFSSGPLKKIINDISTPINHRVNK
jgi:DNA-binding NarL/FixJ family response regulator